MFHSFIPTSHRSLQAFLYGLLVVTLSKTVFSNIQHILLFRDYWLLSKHAIAMVTVMLRVLVVGSSVVAEETSTWIILCCYTNRSVSVQIIGRLSRSKLLDFVCCHFPIIFYLNCVQEFAPIFMGKGKISLLIILQLVTHGWEEPVLNCKWNIINRSFFVAYFPISCLITIALRQRGR